MGGVESGEISVRMYFMKEFFKKRKKIKETFPDICDDLSVVNILRYPEVLKADDASAADDELISALKCALAVALDNLNAMRENEGKKLEEDMLSRMDTIQKLVSEVEMRARSSRKITEQSSKPK